MIEERNAFYIVWCPTGKTAPKHRHEYLDQAISEAERLAMQNPGQEFYVMAADQMRCVNNMQKVSFVPPIPF